ncbi:HAD family hydrolase [Polymorphobacter sp. PAMC 29334]|uniref:sulfotransferase-like domain-containing protein n=1 Tax=Polymorphobacter sp. PAMC 29334 TaxID=2862331 RepID=UPI001C768CA1|nr:HAD family hydrolase [Polymorphobacter sp. PAMC 29334]QYE34184.1 HAD family hydrolase [Polymorphobacter sp. PAMC 29334]
MTVRIAMWSGPRNISTAMMRAFENRDDTVVSDEPFYAAYLAATGLDHPMRAEVLASQPTDWRDVAAAVTGPVPGGKPVWYQKHMCHHMIDGFGLDWSDACINAFLIRDPAAVLASYVRKRSDVTLGEIGVVRQAEIFDRVAQRTGTAPPVIETADVLAEPRGMLTALCAALGVDFSERMLSWPAGPRASDGVWAPAWYDVVEQSTGFAPPSPAAPAPALPDDLRAIADAAQPYYDNMARWRLAAARA